jgi:hypothetical protein
LQRGKSFSPAEILEYCEYQEDALASFLTDTENRATRRDTALPSMPFRGTTCRLLERYAKGISYLWPECVIRARKSRRLSATVLPKNSPRSAVLILPTVALMAVAHLSMPSALG